MSAPADSIRAYLHAKDRNQPYLMEQAFTENASLHMAVHTDTITFPPATIGREAITDLLVRRFAQTYENVHTLCMSAPPAKPDTELKCDWLVVMAEKESRQVRVGCGHYNWRFCPYTYLVEHLSITMEAMQFLAPNQLSNIMILISGQSYPWCASEVVMVVMNNTPEMNELNVIREYICRIGST